MVDYLLNKNCQGLTGKPREKYVTAVELLETKMKQIEVDPLLVHNPEWLFQTKREVLEVHFHQQRALGVSEAAIQVQRMTYEQEDSPAFIREIVESSIPVMKQLTVLQGKGVAVPTTDTGMDAIAKAFQSILDKKPPPSKPSPKHSPGSPAHTKGKKVKFSDLRKAVDAMKAKLVSHGEDVSGFP